MIIYKVTNKISGKIYVGKAIRNKDDYYGSGIKINDAIKSYGKENFNKEIICECSEFNILNMLEIFFINFLQSNDPKIGYNMTDGGEGGDLMSNHPRKKEIYEKIRLANTGNNHFTRRMSPEEYKKYIEKKSLGTSGENHYSKQLSPEEYEKFRQQCADNRGHGKNHPKAKKIKVTGPDGNEYIFHGNFKSELEKMNNGNTGLYLFLLKKLKNNLHIPKTNKTWKKPKKYEGWDAIYI